MCATIESSEISGRLGNRKHLMQGGDYYENEMACGSGHSMCGGVVLLCGQQARPDAEMCIRDRYITRDMYPENLCCRDEIDGLPDTVCRGGS